MIQERKTYLITCDSCRSSFQYSALSERDLPPGWRTVQVGPCGMTDYYRTEHRCSGCSDEGDPPDEAEHDQG